MTIDKPEQQLIVSILAHEPHIKNDEIHVSLRLHFQYMKTDLSTIKNRLFLKLKKIKFRKDYFKLEFSAIDAWNTMIQTDSLNENISMIGNSDSPNIPVWELGTYFSSNQ